jgi:hypothetical protein
MLVDDMFEVRIRLCIAHFVNNLHPVQGLGANLNSSPPDIPFPCPAFSPSFHRKTVRCSHCPYHSQYSSWHRGQLIPVASGSAFILSRSQLGSGSCHIGYDTSVHIYLDPIARYPTSWTNHMAPISSFQYNLHVDPELIIYSRWCSHVIYRYLNPEFIPLSNPLYHTHKPPTPTQTLPPSNHLNTAVQHALHHQVPSPGHPFVLRSAPRRNPHCRWTHSHQGPRWW